jgi:pimeloyl-ACP methyl ester carboxylesterase
MEGGGIVLVHGGMHTGSCWRPVESFLKPPTIAVTLPGRIGASPDRCIEVGLGDYVDAIVAAAEAADFDRFIIVGHSLGGLSLIHAAAALGDRVHHLIFVSSLVPEPGCAPIQFVPEPLRGYVRRRLLSCVEKGKGGMQVHPLVARYFLCHDLDGPTTRHLLAQLRPEPPRPLLDIYEPPTLPFDVTRTYVGFSGDRVINARRQHKIAAQLGAAFRSCPGGHDSFVGTPRPLAAVINELSAVSLGSAET